jgi:limonene-1,2-epoxide hydrolase
MSTETASTEAVSVVRSFFDEMAKPGNLVSALETHCADHCVWQNSGLPTCDGLPAMKEFMTSFAEPINMVALTVDWIACGADGNKVVTERVDYFDDADGNHIMPGLEIGGTLVVENGKIVAWRDYFDPRPLLPES